MTSVELVLPIRHQAQAQVYAERNRFNVVACGRRWGKTTFAQDLIIEDPGWGVLDGNPCGWFAGTSKIFDEVWRLALETLRPVIARTDTQKHRLELVTGGILDFWSLDGGDRGGAGRGRKYKRVVIDEAALVPEFMDVWSKAIRPTLTDMRGDAWFMSTPRGLQNDFYQLYQRGIDGSKKMRNWRSWQQPTSANPHISREELDDLKKEYAGRALDYRQEILAEFVADAGAVFQLSWLTEQAMPKAWRMIARGEAKDLPRGAWPMVYESWDLAGTKKDLQDGGCYSVGMALCKDWLQRWWLLDVVRGKWDAGELVEQMLTFGHKWRAQQVWGEDPVMLYLLPFIQRRMKETGKFTRFDRAKVQGRGDKVARATASVVPVMANGSFYVDPTMPWLPDFKDELASFPNGYYLDQVDALSLGLAEAQISALESTPPPTAGKPDEEQKITWKNLEPTEGETPKRRSPWKR